MKKILMLIDESYEHDFCSVCVVCIQGEENIDLVREKVKKMKIDPQLITTSSGDGRHYAEDGIGARQVVASKISTMPISAYICLSETVKLENKQELDEYTYSFMLPKIIKSLMQKYHGSHDEEYDISLEFENLSDKRGNDLVFFEKQISHLRDEFQFSCSVVGKNGEPLIFLPDYFLGFTRDLIIKKRNAEKLLSGSKRKPETWPAQYFNLLANKIGIILLMDEDKIKRFGRGRGVADFLSVHRND